MIEGKNTIVVDVEKVAGYADEVTKMLDLYRNQGVQFIRQSRTSDFSWALLRLKKGDRLSRHSWEKGKCIFLVKGHTVNYNKFQKYDRSSARKSYDPPYDVTMADHIDMKDFDDVYVTGWTPSQRDLLAEDWYVLKG